LGSPLTNRLPVAQAPPFWPDGSLDLVAIHASGWRPTPFRDVVLKVHQRCNLACDYCYVYTKADQSWRERPSVMSRGIWQAAACRMAEHASTHGLADMRLILHGGEPLLAGARMLAELTDDFRAAFDGGCKLGIQMQTNGVLLDEQILRQLQARDVRIGVSLDGAVADNDRHRRRADGRGSHADVDRALRLLASDKYRDTFAGLLCTVDLGTSPVTCYETLIGYEPPALDLLLPHANWSDPPVSTPDSGPTPYADWLIAVFDRWYYASDHVVRLRLFDDLLALILGGAGRSEQIGLSPVAVIVVESDGTIELVDSLKSAYPGACATGYNVFSDPLDAALDHPGVVARQIGVDALSATCRSCPVHLICGSGHYAHRYKSGEGFRNPTVYCADMLMLIGHVRHRVDVDLKRLSADMNS
jgi:uncharacterized protein